MMLSAGNGFIMQSEKYSRDNAGQSLKKYILLKQGELAYNHGASKAKQFGCCYELTEPEARIPYVYHCFKIIEHEYTPYIAMTLNNPKLDKQLKRLVSSSVRMDGLLNISFEDYMSVSLHLPSTNEQKRIANFIQKIDERIVAQEKLLASLKKYKRGAVQKLFSEMDMKQWELVRLKDVVNIFDGTHQTPNYKTTGVRFISVENILNPLATQKYISEDDYINLFKNICHTNLLLYGWHTNFHAGYQFRVKVVHTATGSVFLILSQSCIRSEIKTQKAFIELLSFISY